MFDLLSANCEESWIVGGWFTPDYLHYARQLSTALDRLGAPYHLVARDKIGTTWEVETMQKVSVVRQLREHHKGKTLVLLDVDCELRKSPLALVNSVRGDVAAYVFPKRSLRPKERARIKIFSTTMVFRPTHGATHFIDAWENAQAECESTDVDQTSLMIAFGRTTGFTFEPLGPEWCALSENHHPDPAILHLNAGRFATKASWWQRASVRLRRSI